MLDYKINGKNVVITGATKGIGKEIAKQLWKQGCNLSICAREIDKFTLDTETYRTSGKNFFIDSVDVTNEICVDSFVTNTVNYLGGVDALILNAGACMGEGIEEATLDEWRETFEINFFHNVSFIKKFLPVLKTNKISNVILISSISGWLPTKKCAQYSCSKAAQIHLANCLSLELAKYNIIVNCISPGSTFFEGGGWDKTKKSDPDNYTNYLETQFPLKRFATPNDIAGVCSFLLSSESKWINGKNIKVDGAQMSADM
jgi:3-oxoacyl-[acyl-carrier protein] reductase